MHLSSATDTTLLPSGLYLTPHTWSACSLNVYKHFRSATSQIFTDLSLDDDAKCLPSPENDTLSTHDACPERVPTTSEWALCREYFIKALVPRNEFAQAQLTHRTASYGRHPKLWVTFESLAKSINFVRTWHDLQVSAQLYLRPHRKCWWYRQLLRLQCIYRRDSMRNVWFLSIQQQQQKQ